MGRTPRTDAAGARGDGRPAPGPDQAPRTLGPMQRGVLVLGLVGLAVLAGSLAGPWDPPLRADPSPPPPAPPPSLPPAPTTEPDPLLEALEGMDVQPWDLTWLGVTMLTLIGLAAAYLVLRWARNRPPRPVEEDPDDAGLVPGDLVAAEASPSPDLPELRAGLEGAGEHLRTARRPADAVIAAWVALEEAAGRSGVVRDPASTPTEFTVAVLDRTPADRAATRVLLGLYLRARFGDEHLLPDDVAAARAAVRTLATGLGADDGRPDDDPSVGGSPREDR